MIQRREFTQVANPISLYSLFYVDRDRNDHVNLRKDGGSALDVYVNCGLTLANSCRLHGVPFTVITNDKAAVDARAAALGGSFPSLELTFDLDVPDKASFYAAHFKLDVIKAFASGKLGDFVGLVDMDMVMLRPLQLSRETGADFFVYDIADHVRGEFGDERILRDLRRIGGPDATTAYWYGGEFLAGTPAAFARLHDEIRTLWPAYRSLLSDLHHVGDEIIVTAALARLQQGGMTLVDVGSTRDVGRWWTARTGFRQVPLRAMRDVALLHLPSDKPFLATRSGVTFQPAEFFSAYRSYARGRLFRRRLANPLLNLWHSERRFAARL